MMMTVIGKIWKMMPRELRIWLSRRFQPKFTVSAGAIITNQNGEVLLLDHFLRPSSGWGVPGGFLEKGEQPEAGLRREIMEETGIELQNVRVYRMRTFRRHIEIIYLADGVGQPQVMSREIKRLGWFAVEEMPPEMSLDQQFMVRKALNAAE